MIFTNLLDEMVKKLTFNYYTKIRLKDIAEEDILTVYINNDANEEGQSIKMEWNTFKEIAREVIIVGENDSDIDEKFRRIFKVLVPPIKLDVRIKGEIWNADIY
ncbi:MAG: hypothetical protein NTX82_06670 [Candidatus Parcubacteria bacterium]|nr:hypothetical protein [Candidatus Parcubacteria bacterium]